MLEELDREPRFPTPRPESFHSRPLGSCRLPSREELGWGASSHLQHRGRTSHQSRRQRQQKESRHCHAHKSREDSPLCHMLQRCQTEQAAISLEMRIKLVTFKTILEEWQRPQADCRQLYCTDEQQQEGLKAAKSGLFFFKRLNSRGQQDPKRNSKQAHLTRPSSLPTAEMEKLKMSKSKASPLSILLLPTAALLIALANASVLKQSHLKSNLK